MRSSGSYLPWPPSLSGSYRPRYPALVNSNSLGGGAMMGFVAMVYSILSSFFAEEQIRLRTVRGSDTSGAGLADAPGWLGARRGAELSQSTTRER